MRDKMNIFLNHWLFEKSQTKSQQEGRYHNKPHFALFFIKFLQIMYVKMRSAIVERNEKAVLDLKGGRCGKKYKEVMRNTKVKPTKTSYEKSNKSTILHAALIVIFFLGNIPINLYASDSKAKRCKGEFINPITDICWECLFPITIGSIELKGSDKPNTKNPSSPVCLCIKGKVPLPGITGGFWEPARMGCDHRLM